MRILLPVAMLGLTTSGILGSFIGPLRKLSEAAHLGDYLVIVFCVGIGSQVDLAGLRLANLELIGLGLSIIYGAIVLHYGLCWLAGIDRDTAIIASAAAILSPPLLGPVAERLGNRQVLISGLTTGVAGYALGTYLGIALANLIEAFK